MVNRDRLIHTLQNLVRINSENPPGNETRIAGYVVAYLKKLGVSPRVYAFKKNRPNVVAVIPGDESGSSLLITPHLDTVPAGKSWTRDPFAGKIEGGKLYGLGATDCKVNLACALEVISSLREERVALGYRLIFAATADEESGSNLGLIPLLEKGILKATSAVVLDSDEFDIVITQKGLMHLKVKIQGKRAHGAYPWRGVNAIDSAVNILKELKSRPLRPAGNKYLKGPTVNIGTIHGGDKVNVVADWCEFELDFRFLPGESEQELLRGLRKIIRKYTTSFKIEIEGIQEPYLIAETHPLVMHLIRAAKSHKITPRVKGSEGATVITFFQHKKIPAVAWGFGSSGCAHTTDEYVRVDNLYKGASALETFLKNYR